ncbi:MAG: hypothetical protein HYX88_03380 [Chloroflexi bacterium]|nr:hypothetical protein [Chloroflexota bacterium]
MGTAIILIDIIRSRSLKAALGRDPIDKAVAYWRQFLEEQENVADTWSDGDAAGALIQGARKALNLAYTTTQLIVPKAPPQLTFRVVLDWSPENIAKNNYDLAFENARKLSKETSIDGEIVLSEEFRGNVCNSFWLPPGRDILRIKTSDGSGAFIVTKESQSVVSDTGYESFVDDGVRDPLPEEWKKGDQSFLLLGIDGLGKRYYCQRMASNLKRANKRLFWVECNERLSLKKLLQDIYSHLGRLEDSGIAYQVETGTEAAIATFAEAIKNFAGANQITLFLIDFHLVRDRNINQLVERLLDSDITIVPTASQRTPLVYDLEVRSKIKNKTMEGFNASEIRYYLGSNWPEEDRISFAFIQRQTGGHPALFREIEHELRNRMLNLARIKPKDLLGISSWFQRFYSKLPHDEQDFLKKVSVMRGPFAEGTLDVFLDGTSHQQAFKMLQDKFVIRQSVEGYHIYPPLLREWAYKELISAEKSLIHEKVALYFKNLAFKEWNARWKFLDEALYHFRMAKNAEGTGFVFGYLAAHLDRTRNYGWLNNIVNECQDAEVGPVRCLYAARVAYKKDDIGRAEKLLKEFESKLSSTERTAETIRMMAAAKFLSGKMLFKKREHGQAITAFQQSIDLYKGNTFVNLYRKSEQEIKVAQCFDLLEQARIARYLGKSYQELDSYPEAILWLNRCLTYVGKADVLIKAVTDQTIRNSLSLYTDEEKNFSDFELAQIKFEMGNYQDDPAGGRKGARFTLDQVLTEGRTLLERANEARELTLAEILKKRVRQTEHWIAQIDLNQGRYAEALVTLQRLEGEWKREKDIQLAEVLPSLGHYYCDRNQLHLARSYYNEALKHHPDLSLKTRIHDRLHHLYRTLGDPKKGRKEAKIFCKLSDKATKRRDKEYRRVWEGRTSQEKGDYKAAYGQFLNIEGAEDSWQQRLKTLYQDARRLAYVYYRLGNVFYDLREYEKARDCYHGCILERENMGDERGVAWAKRRLAMAKVQLAFLTRENGERSNLLDEGKGALNEALEYFEKASQHDGEAFCLTTQAWIEYQAGNFNIAKTALEKCEKLLKDSEDINENLDERRLKILIEWVRARTLVGEGKRDEAKKHFQEANHHCKSHFTHLRLAHEMAVLYDQMGLTEEAAKWWRNKSRHSNKITIPDGDGDRFYDYMRSEGGT